MTPLGGSAASTWGALLAGRYLAGHSRIPLTPADGLPRATQLGLAAGAEALSCVRDPSRLRDATLIVGTSKGPVESWLCGGDTTAGLADIATELASRLRIRGAWLTISAACASGLHALIRAAMMILGGEARRVLVVATEASVHPLFVGSFRRLGVLASEETGCRPFDESRDGFIISEVAAAVCLEADAVASGDVLIDRFFIGGDATHLTGTDPDAQTLRRALQQVIGGGAVDLFHAHGTGTKLNDEAELAAIDDAADFRPPAHLYSHKGALGHSLGAAGLVSVVLNVLMHRNGVVLPNVRTSRPMPANKVQISSSAVRRPIRRSVVTAAGFGGPVAAVSLQSSPV